MLCVLEGRLPGERDTTAVGSERRIIFGPFKRGQRDDVHICMACPIRPRIPRKDRQYSSYSKPENSLGGAGTEQGGAESADAPQMRRALAARIDPADLGSEFGHRCIATRS